MCPPDFCIVLIETKYYSDDVAIVQKIEYIII